ncbi:DUF4041 domain-containing protein [Streptococcus suis]|nr:DUF4041 domain-containing protein [Streptococcus suis]
MGLFNFGKPKDEILQEKINKLQSTIDKKRNELDEIKRQIKIGKDTISIDAKLIKKQQEFENLEKQIAIANDTLDMQEFGFFERQYKFSDSIKFKDALDTLRMKQKSLVKSGEAAEIITPMTLDGSAAKGKTMQNQLRKAAIRGFNGEADALLVKVTVANADKKIQALRRAFDQLNKMYEKNLIRLTHNYLDLKVKELRLVAEYELKKQEEKEILREQRAKEREDKKLQAEITAKRKQLDKDKKHFTQMIENVEKLLTTAVGDEIEKLKIQLSEYQNKLSELDEIEQDIDYREGHATAGYVYIISNIGAFGEDVYKIGVTRRLEPMERIRELGSASVPFAFDVHALIFSEEAFALETELHNKFDKYKVNKLNNRKEYFKVPFTEIKKVLAEYNELAIELTEYAEAFEYRQSLLKVRGV